MAAMPFIFVASVRMRNVLFPVSWLIQSRLADVATIVDENINGVRIVKSFAAEDKRAQLPGPGRAAAALGLRQGRRHPGPVHAAGAEPLPGRAGPGDPVRRLPGRPRAPAGRDHPHLQLLDRHAAGALPDAGDADHARPAGVGVGEADLRGPGRAAHGRRPAGRRRPRRVPGRRPLRRRDLLPTSRAVRRSSTASTCTCDPGKRWPWWGAPAPASPPWPGCSTVSTTCPAERCGSTATTCAT